MVSATVLMFSQMSGLEVISGGKQSLTCICCILTPLRLHSIFRFDYGTIEEEMKYFYMSLLILVISTSCFNKRNTVYNDNINGFLNSNWGDTKEKVLEDIYNYNVENIEITESALFCFSEYLNKKVAYTFRFWDDKLYSVDIWNSLDPETTNKMLDAFIEGKKISSSIIKKGKREEKNAYNHFVKEIRKRHGKPENSKEDDGVIQLFWIFGNNEIVLQASIDSMNPVIKYRDIKNYEYIE
jgi:hypothetical protein